MATTTSAPLVTAGVALAGVGLVALLDPSGRHVPLCPLNATTGLDCPFCGGLRSVQDLARFDLAGAVGHNVLLVAALPLVAVAWFAWWRRRRTVDAPPSVAPRWLLPATLVVLAAFGVARNLPVDGLSWMAAG